MALCRPSESEWTWPGRSVSGPQYICYPTVCTALEASSEQEGAWGPRQLLPWVGL